MFFSKLHLVQDRFLIPSFGGSTIFLFTNRTCAEQLHGSSTNGLRTMLQVPADAQRTSARIIRSYFSYIFKYAISNSWTIILHCFKSERRKQPGRTRCYQLGVVPNLLVITKKLLLIMIQKEPICVSFFYLPQWVARGDYVHTSLSTECMRFYAIRK